jgi:carboxyl-terminal processing protease
MSNFTEGTIDELVEVVSRLKDKEGMRGFIFDLRDNPGGPLKAAVDVSDLFLDAEKLIVSTKDRHEQPWVKTSSNEKHFTDFPMVVVANRYSASASEIVTGALQVHNRALIVGERTYGKGSVQQVLPLNHSRLAFLKLTTALYYLPNGRCLHKEDDSTTWGVDPDVLVDLVPKERIKVNAHRLKKDILKGKNQKQLTEEELEEVAGYEPSTQPADDEDGKAPDEAEKGAEPDEALQDSAPGAEKEFSPGEGEEDEEEMITRSDPNDWPEIDPQLEAALLLMRIRLETNQPWKPDAEALAATPAAPTGS